MVAIIPTDTDLALDTIRAHARSAAYHRTLRQRWAAITAPAPSLHTAMIDPQRLARQHEVSMGIADTRLKHALADARETDVDPGVMQIAVMDGESAGVDDAQREMPFWTSFVRGHRYVIDKRPGSSTFGFCFLADVA